MTKLKFRTQFNPSYKGAKGKVFKGESMTRPEDIMSLKQLLHNHTRNIQSNASHHEGIYTEEQVVPQIRDMNDIVEHRNALNERKNDVESKVKQERETKKKQKEAEEAARKAADDSKTEKGIDPSTD